MRGAALWTVFVCAVTSASCAPPPRSGKGGPCHSIGDCDPGYACVRAKKAEQTDDGVCTANLKNIAGHTPDYPMTMPASASDAGPDGG